MKYPESIRKLIENLKLLPGVGEKTAERYVFFLMNLDKEKINEVCKSLIDLKDKLKTCPNCGCLIEDDHCFFCDSKAIKKDVLCIVETQKDVFLLESINSNNMKYHVLGGLISPLDGIYPEDLNIKHIKERVIKEDIKEVILTFKPGIESSTTMLYIKKILENTNTKVTQIAQGVPIGTDIEYLDIQTIKSAMENRKEVS